MPVYKTLTRRRLQARGIAVALGGAAFFAASWYSIVAQAGKDGTRCPCRGCKRCCDFAEHPPSR